MAQARIYATGKRKTAVARVYIKAGAGRITVNGREFEEYFPVLALRAVATQPLVLTGKRTLVDVDVNIGGGGPMSQAESVKFGIAKALQIENPELRTQLKRAVPDPRRADQGAEKVRPAGGAETVPVLQAVSRGRGEGAPNRAISRRGRPGNPPSSSFLSGG